MNDLEIASDTYLIGSIANGDADAVRPLIDRYRKPLVAVLHRALGASPDLDDVYQETWMRVVRSAHSFDPSYRFSSWLFGIAWNLVKNRWAAKQYEHVSIPEMPSPECSAEDRLVDSDRAERVREQISALPERLSQAILLRYFEELSEKEVAERLGVPLGTVKSRLHTALKKLADLLEEDFA